LRGIAQALLDTMNRGPCGLFRGFVFARRFSQMR